jgi:hypothetical protein
MPSQSDESKSPAAGDIGVISGAADASIADRCPACGHANATRVVAAASAAVDGREYFQCRHCQSAFRKSQSRAEQRRTVAVGGFEICVACGLYWWFGWIWFPAILGLLGVFVVWLGIDELSKPLQGGTVIELHPAEERRPDFAAPKVIDGVASDVPEDFSPPPAKLKEWLEAQAARDRPVVRILQRFVGTIFAFVGGCMLLCAGGFSMQGFNPGGRPRPNPFGDLSVLQMGLLLLGVLAVGLIGMWISSVGKGLKGLSSPAWKLLLKSRRPPILLLRSFDDDRHRLWTGGVMERKFNPGHLSQTLEDAFAEVFSQVGEPVTLSRPGERLPPSGAARARLSNSEWQTWVHEFLGWSQRVVMVMGNVDRHPALAWELQTIFADCRPEKLLIVLPPNVEEAEMEARWRSYSQFLNGRIPEYRPDAVLLRYTTSWNVLVTTTQRYRSLSSEEKRAVFVSVLSAHRDWQRPDDKIKGLQTSTELIECNLPEQEPRLPQS